LYCSEIFSRKSSSLEGEKDVVVLPLDFRTLPRDFLGATGGGFLRAVGGLLLRATGVTFALVILESTCALGLGVSLMDVALD